jgi:murein DD-endopeptidase MepM/ murein hydrolase activator NlpD
MAGQTVTRGEVIGYVGHSGRVSGPSGNHVHYEVRIRNTPVNPHKYLRMTLAELGGETQSAPTASVLTGPMKAAGLDR